MKKKEENTMCGLNLDEYKGKEVSIDYRKASGELKNYFGKLIKIEQDKIMVWVKDKGMRKFFKHGVLTFNLMDEDSMLKLKIDQIMKQMGYNI